MSPVFRHGRLRLYLLKLLDEAPRHGYEVIRLLQDRFLGVYAPSPGTIYPRLARLEEEGLVTHDEVNGRKVYRITDKGREELRARFDDLAELEETITASVRDVAREVTEDVRETVRSLREELAWVARDIQDHAAGHTGPTGKGSSGKGPSGKGATGEDAWAAASGQAAGQGEDDTARAGRQKPEHEEAGRGQDRRGRAEERAGSQRDHRSGPGAGWDWGDWGGWAGRGGWGSWGWHGERGEHGPRGCPDPHAYRDLEKLARQFTGDLRRAAWQAQAVGEDAVRELRGILDETIDRIKSEVFGGKGESRRPGAGDAAGRDADPGQ